VSPDDAETQVRDALGRLHDLGAFQVHPAAQVVEQALALAEQRPARSPLDDGAELEPVHKWTVRGPTIDGHTPRVAD